jgi:hypothetical protein
VQHQRSLLRDIATQMAAMESTSASALASIEKVSDAIAVVEASTPPPRFAAADTFERPIDMAIVKIRVSLQLKP